MGVTSMWTSLEGEFKAKRLPGSQLWEWLKERVNFSKYVPRPREGVVSREFEGKKGTYYVVKSPTGEYAKMDPANYYLWSQMDGKKSIADISLAYFMKFRTFAFGRLSMLVASLREKGFLDDTSLHLYARVHRYLTKEKKIVAWGDYIVQTFMKREFAIRGLDGLLTKMYAGGVRFLFLKPMLWLYWATTIVGIVLFGLLVAQRNYSFITSNDSLGMGILWLYVGQTLAFVMHEAAHAFTVKHYGHEVHRGGAMTYLGSLAFFVDTKDIWLADKRARIAVSWAGPFINFVQGGILAIVIFFMPDFVLNDVLFKIATVTFFGALFNLNPLTELDGYFILMDWLEIPSLRQRSLSFLKGKLPKKLRERKFVAEERVFLIFGLLVAVYTTFVLVASIFLLQQRVVPMLVGWWNQPGVWGKLIVSVLLTLTLVPLIYTLMMRLYALLSAFVTRLIARGVFASKRNVALIMLLPAVLFHAILWVGGQGSWAAEFCRLAILLLGLGAILLVLRNYDQSHLQRAILALGPPLFIFLAAEGVNLIAWLGQGRLVPPAVTLLRAAGLVTFTATVYLSFNTDNLRFASPAERGLVALLLMVSAVAGVLTCAWLLSWSVPTVLSVLVSASVGITLTNLALLIPLLVSFWRSQLRYAWIYVALTLITLGLTTVGDAMPLNQANLERVSAFILSLGYSFLSGSVALYYLAQIQAYAQLRSAESRVGPSAHAQLTQVVQHLTESLLRQYQALLGERQLRTIQDTLNAIAISARWGLAIDRGRLVVSSGLLDKDVIGLSLVYRQLLDQIITSMRQGGGRRFVKQTLQRAYDSLTWENRELANEYILKDTHWGGWLSQQFQENRQDYTALLSRIPLFFQCSPEELNAICARLQERSYPAGASIIRQGDIGDEFYIIQNGKVTVWQKDDQGWDQLINEHSRGGTFGELALLHDAPRNATCVAAAPTAVLVLGRKDFQLVHHYFDVKEKIDQSIRHTQILQDIPLFSETPVERLKQIAAHLLTESFEANQVFVRQGEVGDKFYVIEKGEVEVFTTDNEGQEKPIARRRRGEYVGEIALLLDIPRTASMRTLTSSTLLTLTRGEFLELMEQELELHQSLERVSSRRMYGLSRNVSLETELIAAAV